MRLIYICSECDNYIDEVEIPQWDERLLGFDVLSADEKEELVHIDWSRGVGTVKALCDRCLAARQEETLPDLEHRIH